MFSYGTLRTALAALALTALAGCGGGGGGSDSATANVTAAGQEPRALTDEARFEVTGDSYGLQNPSWLHATHDGFGFVLRAELVEADREIWFDTNVFRFDCPDGIEPGSYALGGEDAACSAHLFNGHPTSRLKTVSGWLTVEEAGDTVSGSFQVVFADGYHPQAPLQWYSGEFACPVGYGAGTVPELPAVPPGGEAVFARNCAACHQEPELVRCGSLLEEAAAQPPHQEILLTEAERRELKTFLNALPAPGDPELAR